MKHLIKLNEFFDYDSWLNKGNPYEYEEDENDPDYIIAGDQFTSINDLLDAIEPFVPSRRHYSGKNFWPVDDMPRLEKEFTSNFNTHSNQLYNNIIITSDDSKTRSHIGSQTDTMYTILKTLPHDVIDDFLDEEEIIEIEWVLYNNSILIGHMLLNLTYTVPTSPESEDNLSRPIKMIIMNKDFYVGLDKFTKVDDMFRHFVKYFTAPEQMTEFFTMHKNSYLEYSNPYTNQETDHSKKRDKHIQLVEAFKKMLSMYTIQNYQQLVKAFAEINSTIDELAKTDGLSFIL